MKLPHRRQFLHLAAAAAASARRRYEDPARLGAKGGVSREPSRPSQVGGLRLGNAWRQKFLATPAASFWRRQLSPSHASRHSRALAIELRVPTSTSTAMASKERTVRDRLRGWRDRKTQTWPTETRLRGWAGRTRTQKCRRKLPL